MLARLSVVQDNILLNQDSAPADFDKSQKFALDVASQVANQFTQRTLEKTTYSDQRYTGKGDRELFPRNIPIISIATLKIWDGDSWETIDSDHYEIIDNEIIFYPTLAEEGNATYNYFPSNHPNNIKLTFDAGFDDSDWDTMAIDGNFLVPSRLEYAVAKHTALIWKDGEESGGHLGVTQINKGPEGVTIQKFLKGLPDDIKEVYRDYRIIQGW